MNSEQLKIRPVIIRRELLDHYNQLGINEAELVILIKLLHASESSNKQPSIESLQQGTTFGSREVTTIIQSLIQHDLLELKVEKDEEGKFTEYMNLNQFYVKLSEIMKQVNIKVEEENTEVEFNVLFQQIEQAFGRPLSPFEIETLNQWLDIDKHELSVIQAALDEATSQNKLSFKYIDRILLNWKKNNVKTIEDSKKISRQFNQPKMKHTIKKVPKFDWLNGENPNDK
ncbi:DnaD domain-containing protein [Staphylococcus saprophyticus]|uniref:DnaD domain-containing protein n=1 Tax=Staphylococcus saprophyticus TaxID=29385 RepID=UPI00124849B5|nr:DnaD domain-containing protein [Staphylococcus saprophyticus]MDW3899025.1 DnaD domain-containing protein [Staphylococcus saprophyticus]MDW3903853.1 DnaD domain-containing protein [Staphylococcus saprophyticus]MDW3969024.1 DnaD domain-containing protein [Staphylococcus saprophyticus]MDW3981525.1 DnaD domain-containing protein [Staphylococcus saprophyticus]MDW3994026.1 DnaD domain-containing protein [Staphylococcus saprophyticus]